LEWTDQRPPEENIDGSRFLLTNLIAVRKRLEGIEHKEAKTGTIAPLRKEQIKGEEHGKPNKTKPIVAATPGAAGASDSDTGRDDTAATEQAGGG
jgi:hypothetical protein